MSNIKFTQLPVQPSGNVTATTIVPTVTTGVNYQLSVANLQSYMNSNNPGTITAAGLSVSGNVTGNNITGTVISSTGNVYAQSGITAQGPVTTTSTISASGNIAGNYILGNGSQLTGLPATYNNANVTSLLSNFGSNNISTTGNVNSGLVSASNITAATLSASGNITGNYILGNGGQLTSITGANVTGVVPNATRAVIANTVNDSNQSNITTVGTLTALSVTGNITGSYFVGNGSQLTGISGNLTSGNLTGNLLTGSYYIKNDNLPGGAVYFGDSLSVPGTSTFEGGLVTGASNKGGTIEINTALPNAQVGLQVNTSNANAQGIAISLSGIGNLTTGLTVSVINNANAIPVVINNANASAKISMLKVANIATQAAGARTLDGYLQVIVDGNVRYIPYYQ